MTDIIGPLPGIMREMAGGIIPVVVPRGYKAWLVHDYELGRKVLADKRFSRSETVKPDIPKLNDAEPAGDSIISMDGEEHARLRRIVAGTFTARRVQGMAPLVEKLTDEHLRKMAKSGSPADLMAAIANPLPLAVIGDLLGVPVNDSQQFKDCVEVLFDISTSSGRAKSRRRLELVGYMARLIERKRRRRGHDLLSALIDRHEQGDMSKAELLTMGLTLLMAGYETTVAQIGLMVLTLLSDPPAYQSLLGQPERLSFAIEETLRLNPSTPLSFSRIAVEPVRIGGVTIDIGEQVMVSFLHGNRDEKAFPRSSLLAPGDEGARAHLTFGHGAHRCLGAPLARLQLQIVLGQLLSRFPSLRLSTRPDAVGWKDGLATRGLWRLMVEW
jgi:cytochrome P450